VTRIVIVAGANVLVRALLSPECAACGGLLEVPLESPVCPGCWRGVAPIGAPACVCCGEPLLAGAAGGPRCRRCDARTPAFALARSAGRYDGPLRQIVHAFKFERRRVLARPLAALMRAAGGDVLTGADAVVPVPLHPWRAMRRGFNQADDLEAELGLPVWRVLRRVRHGPPQSALPAGHRHDNVRAAFAVRPAALRMRPGGRFTLRNRAVVLVDDVMTTGATLDACSQALREAGVRRVAALTLARTAAAPPPARPPSRHLLAARHR
jgi:ComF family protein